MNKEYQNLLLIALESLPLEILVQIEAFERASAIDVNQVRDLVNMCAEMTKMELACSIHKRIQDRGFPVLNNCIVLDRGGEYLMGIDQLEKFKKGIINNVN